MRYRSVWIIACKRDISLIRHWFSRIIEGLLLTRRNNPAVDEVNILEIATACYFFRNRSNERTPISSKPKILDLRETFEKTTIVILREKYVCNLFSIFNYSEIPPCKIGKGRAVGNFPAVLNLVYFQFRCKVIKTVFLHAAAFSNIVIFQIYFRESSVLNELTVEYSMSSGINYFYKCLGVFF